MDNVSIMFVSCAFVSFLCLVSEEAQLSTRDRCCAFFPVLRVSALSSLFPFPPRRRSLTPPHHFFLLLCLVVKPLLFFASAFSAVSLNRLSSATMGDIEAPDSDRPRQTVLLSILPSKEFATSRKGMLLIAEVVRNQRNPSWNR